MNFKFLYLTIATIFIISCNENKTSAQNIKKNRSNNLWSKIPENQKVEKREFLIFDNDEDDEIIITTTDKNEKLYYEYWFKNKDLVYKFDYLWTSINYKWLADLDNDGKKEIVRATGYEDGVDYVIYKIIGKEQVAQIYVNPAFVDTENEDKMFWAYPKDIKNVLLDSQYSLTVSLNNNYQREDNHTIPENQKELPFLFFKGKSTQPDFVLKTLNPIKKMNLSALISAVKKQAVSAGKIPIAFLEKFDYDIDGDGIMDKIEIFRNEGEKNTFDQEHFGLPFKIYRGTSKGFEVWTENKNIIPPMDGNCISEGFGNIIFKDNFFTIESQTCYDNNVVVNAYISFVVKNDEILLHKYGETYFDKANHKRKIPDRIWTAKDFGRILFDKVTADFLQKLKFK